MPRLRAARAIRRARLMPLHPRQSGAGGAGRGRARPSGSAAGAEPARARERSRSCRGAMALLPRRFLCFVLGKCGRRGTAAPRAPRGSPRRWARPCSPGRLLRAAPALPEARPGSCLVALAARRRGIRRRNHSRAGSFRSIGG